MKNMPKRACFRSTYEARIRYTILNTESYVDARMLNCSEGGLYFETRRFIEPGSDIYIELIDYASDLHHLAPYKGYRAQVMWCKPVEGDEINCYGAGVRFMVNVCSRCGGKFDYLDIHKTDDLLFLCTDCLKKWQQMPDCRTKHCLKEYMDGNVI